MMNKMYRGISLANVAINLLHAAIFPSILLILYLKGIILLTTLKISIFVFFFIFGLGPLVFKYSYTLQRSVIFVNFVNLPKNPNYSNPEQYGLRGARNLRVTTDEDVELGVWQILPQEFANSSDSSDDFYKTVFENAKQVILYNHGNSCNRAAPHRIELYQALRKHFFVIAFDYRGYGDSSDIEPSEAGLANDSRFMFEWIRNRTQANIFVWGHSLGTAISLRALSTLANKKIEPTGLLLESPFNNLRDEIFQHKISTFFRYLPWFTYTVLDPMWENNLRFESDRYINKINCPILILHAKDDLVVHYELGCKLFEGASKNRQDNQGSVKFIGFEGNRGFAHKFISRAPELQSILSNFIEECKMRLKQMEVS